MINNQQFKVTGFMYIFGTGSSLALDDLKTLLTRPFLLSVCEKVCLAVPEATSSASHISMKRVFYLSFAECYQLVRLI